MTLKEEIQQDLKSAVLAKKQLETSVLRLINAAILNKEKEKRYKIASSYTILKEAKAPYSKISQGKPDISEEDLVKESQLQDGEVIEVISTEVKKRKESIELFEKGQRLDLVDKEKKELEILQNYLPEQLPEEELKKLVKEAVEKVGAREIKDMGKVMAELMPKVKGRAGGTSVSKIVKELLGL